MRIRNRLSTEWNMQLWTATTFFLVLNFRIWNQIECDPVHTHHIRLIGSSVSTIIRRCVVQFFVVARSEPPLYLFLSNRGFASSHKFKLKQIYRSNLWIAEFFTSFWNSNSYEMRRNWEKFNNAEAEVHDFNRLSVAMTTLWVLCRHMYVVSCWKKRKRNIIFCPNKTHSNGKIFEFLFLRHSTREVSYWNNESLCVMKYHTRIALTLIYVRSIPTHMRLRQTLLDASNDRTENIRNVISNFLIHHTPHTFSASFGSALLDFAHSIQFVSQAGDAETFMSNVCIPQNVKFNER